MGEFRMPSLGADMTEGTLLEWLVEPGDTVHHGQIVAVIDTVKSAIDIEAFEDGEVDRLLVEPGATVTVGTPIAVIRSDVTDAGAEPVPAVEVVSAARSADAGAAVGEGSHTPASPLVRRLAHELDVDIDAVAGTGRGGAVTRLDVEHAAEAAVAPAAPEDAESSAVSAQRAAHGHVSAAPRARRLAAQLGVDLATVPGSGPDGAVMVSDVERASRDATVTAPPSSGSPPSVPKVRTASRRARAAAAPSPARKEAMQAATAALMARSKREIPHYYLQSTVDLSAALDWLAAHNHGRAPGDRVLPAALLLKATATSLLRVPELNGFYVEDRFEPVDHVDLGVAIALRSGGLLVANLRGADGLPVDELMARLKDVATRARAGRLTSSEMSVPTVTVTNLGDQGAELVHGVIYPPQVALVGFGRIVERPWAVSGLLGVRPLVVATLAGDHRVTDGQRGSRFLEALDATLQKPEEL